MSKVPSIYIHGAKEKKKYDRKERKGKERKRAKEYHFPYWVSTNREGGFHEGKEWIYILGGDQVTLIKLL